MKRSAEDDSDNPSQRQRFDASALLQAAAQASAVPPNQPRRPQDDAQSFDGSEIAVAGATPATGAAAAASLPATNTAATSSSSQVAPAAAAAAAVSSSQSGSTQQQQQQPSAAAPAPELSYPKPKNFAERLMCVLEGEVAQDSVWWAGEGQAVALHPKKIKKGTVLESHFKVSNYGALLRNFNRWGFRRVTFYTVPDGVVTYKNSLFQREKPHLVKHMRMDSDVQDVFERHQQDDLVSNPDLPSGGASSLNNNPQQQQQLPPQVQLPAQNLAAAAASVGDANFQQRLAEMMNLQSVQQQQQQPLPNNPGASAQPGAISSNMQGVNALSQPSNAATLSSVSEGDAMLQQIQDIIQRYLNLPARNDDALENSIRNVLQLLLLQLQEHQHSRLLQQQALRLRQQQERNFSSLTAGDAASSQNETVPAAPYQRNAASDTAAAARGNVGNLGPSQQQQQQPNAPLGGSDAAISSQLQQFILQAIQGQQAPPQQPAQQPSPQQQPPPQQPPQQNPDAQQLLWALIQQAQQKGNPGNAP